MTRADRYKQVKGLRDQGLLYREIAKRTGLAISTVGDLLNDPTGQAARDRKKRLYGHPCRDCGTTINPNGLRRGTERCAKCHGARLREQSRRWILESFREWDEMFGVPPTATDWNIAMARTKGQLAKVARHEATGRPWPSPTLVIKIFGSWNAGRTAAGFETFEPGHYGRDGEDPQVLAETARLYRSGLDAEAVGDLMGCHAHTVYVRLAIIGEPRRPGRADVNAAKTHCPQGHPYDEANTYINTHGGRVCRICQRGWRRDYYQRKMAA